MSCRYPIQIRDPSDNGSYYVPCGKCAWCKKQKQDQWFARFIEEEKQNSNVRFITLTYNDKNIPQIVDEETGIITNSVDKRDIQKFIKIVRKHENEKFKYFAVSEYGPQTKRPHYHALMFSSEQIDYTKYWKKGFASDVPAEKGAYKYVTKYILKGANVPQFHKKNFMLCSKRPAIGKDYINKQNVERHLQNDENTYYTLPGGQKIALPRYYRKKIFAEEYLHPAIIAQHKEKILENLKTSLRHSREKQKYLKTYGNLDGFEQWLTDTYQLDLKKQKQINNKNKI